MERRLAAILVADVVGYSRLMELDEVGTLAVLKAHRTEFIDPTIAKHGGRTVKLMSDGALVEFPSAVASVECAAEIQRGMVERNAGALGDSHIEFRIGINLGDVIVEGNDLYGEGVNIAARVEGLAEPGGVCLSAKVYHEVNGKLDLTFDDLGFKAVKNIAEPLRVYRVAGEGSPYGDAPTIEAPPLPDKPSIAVLPFTNMSGVPEQEYFSDGITEDIITELSRFPELFVIARNSAFVFKGKAIDIKDAADKLGVRYLVEGSVRKAGNRVRITAQLIDASTGGQIWADRYDRELEDIFEVQDDVVRAIVAVLPGRIADANIKQSRRKPTENLSALDCLMRGNYLASRRGDGHDRAIAAYQKAIELDPNCAAAYAGIAYTEVKRFGTCQLPTTTRLAAPMTMPAKLLRSMTTTIAPMA